MSDAAQIGVLADTAEAASELASRLLPAAGYRVVLPGDYESVLPCDVLLVDITYLRTSPLASLQAQRRLGNQAPAVLIAPRLTGEMAAEALSLDIRDFVAKPYEDSALLQKLNRVVESVEQQRDLAQLRHRLDIARAALQRRLNDLDALAKVGQSIARMTESKPLLRRTLEAAVYLTQADAGMVFLLTAPGQPVLSMHQGLTNQQAALLQRPGPDSDVAAVLATGQPVIRGSDPSHAYQLSTGVMVRAAISVPIVSGEGLAGVLSVHRYSEAPFEAADQVVLTTLAGYAGIGLERAGLMAGAQERVDAALAAARAVGYHAATLYSPIEGIDAQIDTLLTESLGSLSADQRDALARIKLAAERLKEIADFIRHELAAPDSKSSTAGG